MTRVDKKVVKTVQKRVESLDFLTVEKMVEKMVERRAPKKVKKTAASMVDRKVVMMGQK